MTQAQTDEQARIEMLRVLAGYEGHALVFNPCDERGNYLHYDEVEEWLDKHRWDVPSAVVYGGLFDPQLFESASGRFWTRKAEYAPDRDLNHIQRICEKVLDSEKKRNAFVDKLFQLSYSGPKVNSLGEFVWVLGWVNAQAAAYERAVALIAVLGEKADASD